MTTQVEALVILARYGIPPDIQELLVSGDPMRGIRPGALAAAIVSLSGYPESCPQGKAPSDWYQWLRGFEDETGSIPRDKLPRIARAVAGVGLGFPLSADQPRGVKVPEEAIDYVLRYGGRCRDCADNLSALCPTRGGLPCDVDEARTIIAHTVKAINYGLQHGFLSALEAPAPATEPEV